MKYENMEVSLPSGRDVEKSSNILNSERKSIYYGSSVTKVAKFFVAERFACNMNV